MAQASTEPNAEECTLSRQNTVGLVSNTSLSETEAARFFASDALLVEEERLRKEREEQQAAAAGAGPSSDDEAAQAVTSHAPAALENKRFEALETLLNQSEMYTKFLSEQLKDIEQKTEDDAKRTATAAAEEPPTKGKAKGKTKGGKRGRGKAEAEEEPEAKKSKSSLTPTQELLPLLKADLRDYQLKGVKWLISLYQNGVNGILADQMGLGKTVQTIGFLTHLRNKGINGPFLIVGPLSTLPNWVNEFTRFAPSMPALLYHGTKAEREELRAKRLRVGTGGVIPHEFPAIITSYEIVIADVKFLQRYNFKYIVVDEGHRLKNFNCRLIRELKQIPAANRLLLSGTPLQNNLSELWSLLNFLMPDVFSNLSDFEAWFDFSSVVGQEGGDQEIIAAEQRNRVVSKLHAILKPFVLRRLKSDVDISLPRKMEIILYAGMSDKQKDLNKQLLDGTLMGEMSKLADEHGGSKAGMGKLNNVLMQMRKICNHPDLITSAFTNDLDYPTPEELIRECGKMQLLDRLLTRLQAGGHKVLIFSQMTKMLDLLQSFLEQRGHTACRIDGNIPWQERQKNINDFNSDPKTWLFLLSTRAGGLGINLTGADTVIIYDSDWNPHQDMQAMDRCHRLGQSKPVLVFRLATAHSVEGKMLKRAGNKMALERLVIKKGAFKEISEEAVDTSMSANELVELLKADVSLDDVPQSAVVSDEQLTKLLNRAHLAEDKLCPFAPSGVGYEVVLGTSGGSSLLSHINN
mmetsp:Transcript_16682/g.36078  ORF Transcript_16682/g.36078 Transcript_16682/m.36078 type:complete len:748 (+) Transcript_16682:1282-3525(+)